MSTSGQAGNSRSAGTPFPLPPLGGDPSSVRAGTTPASFAAPGRIAPGVAGRYTFSSPDTPGMPDPSTKTAWDFMPPDWTLRPGCEQNYESHAAWTPPAGFCPVTQLEHARLGTITPEMRRVAEREPHLTPEQVREEVAAGRMIIPANRVHRGYNLDPMAIGRASRTKINANMGASPVSSGTDEEVLKLRWAERWGADTVMDLSTGGDLDECREAILQNSTVPVGTVPIYSMIIGRRLEELDDDAIMKMVAHQAEQGVDYFTIHAGVLREHLPYVKNRLIGIVSRGGSLLAKWMLVQGKQNPMYVLWDDICDVMRRYDVSFSIGDGLRPGGLADATDRAQLAELSTLGELTERAWRKGVQVMIEGPGHVPFDQIEYNMKLERHALPRRPVLRAGAAGDRHVPRLRPHHELHRRDGRRVPWRQHALLRDAQGAPRPAEKGRRQAGLHRLQDRGPCGRRRTGHSRHARPRRRVDQGAGRPQLGKAFRAELRSRHGPRLSRRRPRRRHRFLRDVRPRLVQRPHLERDRRVRLGQGGRPTPGTRPRFRRRFQPSSRPSSKSGASSARTKFTAWPPRRANRFAPTRKRPPATAISSTPSRPAKFNARRFRPRTESACAMVRRPIGQIPVRGAVTVRPRRTPRCGWSSRTAAAKLRRRPSAGTA